MLSKTYISRSQKNKFIEPIVVSGQYIGIKLLSVYDFILCIKMYNRLMKHNLFSGLEGDIYATICEQACIASLCTYDSEGKRMFSEPMATLQTLTPYELQKIYCEYNKLQDNIVSKDEISCKIIDDVKKCHKKYRDKIRSAQ